MKIVKVKGGLGNQMFQYGFAKLLEKLTDEEVKIDMSSYECIIDDDIRKPRLLKYNISLDIANSGEIKESRKFLVDNSPLSTKDKIKTLLEIVMNREYYFETDRSYRDPNKLLNFEYYDGYWQSWRYVDVIAEQLRKEFKPNYLMHNDTIYLQNVMKNENSVFIGIRRGDYLAEQKHYGSFGEQYYNAAINKVLELVSNPVFYIFSNDISWIKQNLDFCGCKVNYREQEKIIDDFEELQLMASCQNAIIGNSTFHWWGAWLIENKNKIVVAPYNWFFDEKPIDIVPPEWIKIDRNGSLE